MVSLFKKVAFYLFVLLLYMIFLLILPLISFIIFNSLEYFFFLVLKIIDIFYWVFFFLCIKLNSWWINLVELYVTSIYYQPSETIKKNVARALSLFYFFHTYPLMEVFIVWCVWLYFLFEDDFLDDTKEEKERFHEEKDEEEEIALETPPEDVVDIAGERDFSLEESEEDLEYFEDQDDPLLDIGPTDYFYQFDDTEDLLKEASDDFAVQSSEILDDEKQELSEDDYEYEVFDEEFAYPYPAPSLVEKCFWDFDLPEEFILLRFGWESDLFDQEIFVYLRQTIGFFFIRFFFNFLPMFVIEFCFLHNNMSKTISKIPFLYSFLYFWFLLVETLKKIYVRNILIFLFIFFLFFILFLW